MGFQGSVGFLAHGDGKAVVANGDDGVEVVRRSAVFLALGGAELDRGHVSIIGAP